MSLYYYISNDYDILDKLYNQYEIVYKLSNSCDILDKLSDILPILLSNDYDIFNKLAKNIKMRIFVTICRNYNIHAPSDI